VCDISHINNSNLTHLLLADNAIASVSSLQLQSQLRVLDVSHNQLVTLDGLDHARVPLLSTLRLPFNRIESFDEVTNSNSHLHICTSAINVFHYVLLSVHSYIDWRHSNNYAN
jgi:Leucine-rich repeat (LRR) protein